MKNLLLTLLLISPASFADWGDVYYCQMTSFTKLIDTGYSYSFDLDKFQFKLDETKQAMVFGKGGFFNEYVLKLEVGFAWPQQEKWGFVDSVSRGRFWEGRLLYSILGEGYINTISADCDKF